MENIFTAAKAYKKKHPATSWQDCIAACAGKAGKKTAVGRVKKSKPAAKKTAAPAKVKIKVKKGGNVTATIGRLSGVSMKELDHALLHLGNLEKIEDSTKYMLKDTRHKSDWPALRRQLANSKKAIASQKQHIAALKRAV